MLLLPVDDKEVGRRNPSGKMEAHYSSKGIRRMGSKESRVVLQIPRCKNFVETILKSGLTPGKDHSLQILLRFKVN